MLVVTSLSLFCNLVICANLSPLCLKFHPLRSNNPILLTLTYYRQKPKQLHLLLYKTKFIQVIFSKSFISKKSHRDGYAKNSWSLSTQTLWVKPTLFNAKTSSTHICFLHIEG
jgi:hypothetical protein